MGNGLGELGFWLAAGIVFAAMIVSGAIKERDRERDSQAMLRADLERKLAMRQTLLENAGDNMPEVLAYLRERDTAAAERGAAAMARIDADVRRKRMNEPRVFAIVGAFMVAAFSFMGGIFSLTTQQRPQFPRLQYSAEAHRLIPVPPPPPPTGWAALAPVGVMLAIWAAGLIKPVLGQLVDGAPHFMGVPVPMVLGVLVAGLALSARRLFFPSDAGVGFLNPIE